MEMKDIQDIFYNHLNRIKESNLPAHVKKTAADISYCRTNAMHGHVYQCPQKHFTFIVRNSCNNRNCPTCQTHHRISWQEKTKNKALKTSHYQIVMKLPSFINQYFLKNYQDFVNILFESGKKTIYQILKYSQYEFTNPGFIMAMHTYGEENQLHPHLHIVMTGGGLSSDGKNWIDYDNSLFSIDNFNVFYHAILIEQLKKFTKKNPLFETEFNDMIKGISKHDIFISEKYPTADKVINYLSNTVKGTSIQNKDIIEIQNNIVNFKSKSDKIFKINEEEFIRRYLLHVFPPKTKSVRYSGLYSPNSKNKLAIARSLIIPPILQEVPLQQNNDGEITTVDIHPFNHCPICERKMVMIEKILPFCSPRYITSKYGKDPPLEKLYEQIAA